MEFTLTRAPTDSDIVEDDIGDLSDPKFEHNPLDTTTGQIRLFRLESRIEPNKLHEYRSPGLICGQLEIFELDEAPPYIALSYTWGARHPLRSIRIDWKPFNIRKNLWLFLATFCALDNLNTKRHFSSTIEHAN
jgi:hypothetical protein